MKVLFEKSKKLVNTTKNAISQELSSSFSLVMEMVNKLPVLISSERSDAFHEIQYDEKHYFVIPFRLSEIGIALHTMRCLPTGVPELNDLPKRRIFHFARDIDESAIRNHLINEAKDIVTITNKDRLSSLESLANDIDGLDKKLTYGMLCLGGLAALANPVIGAGIAAKALVPGVAGLLSKYTLRPIGEKMTESQLQSQIKVVEDKIIKDFESANTIKVINPILQELELALNTDESQHDPLFDFDLGQSDIEEIDGERWRELTVTALKHTYQNTLNKKSEHKQARLGPEDIRWFNVLFGQKG